MNKLKTIAKSSIKPYQCTKCGNEIEICTNHWGDCYPNCIVCVEQTIHKCNEELPKGFTIPTKWEFVKCNDLFKEFGNIFKPDNI